MGFTTDHRALILSARRRARSGGFVLELDDALLAALSDAAEQAAARAEDGDEGEEVTAPPPPRPQSTLPVRELQARLRAGRSVEEVAAEAGVDAEWVARFAAPVIAEQRRVVAATQSAVYVRTRLGASALPIGESIRRNLADRGLALTAEELDGGWSARQVADGRWLVSLTYRSRGRRQSPSWELDVRTGEVRARDRLAGDLAFVIGGPRPATSAVGKPTRVPAAQPSDGDRETARRVTIARKAAEAQLDEAARAASKRDAEVARRAGTRPAKDAATPPAAPPTKEPVARKAVAKRAVAKKTTAKKPTGTKATPKKPAARKPPAKKAATKRAAAKKAVAKKAVAKKAAPTGMAAARTPARARARAPKHAPGAARSRGRPPGNDVVAEALAAVRREVEQELTAFATRRARPQHVAPPPEPPTMPTPTTATPPPTPPSTPPRVRPVAHPALDVATVASPPPPLPPAGQPVFRGDVAPAGSPNGASPDTAAPRRRRREPLRAR